MAIAMPGVGKFDRKILVAYLRPPPRSHKVANTSIFRSPLTRYRTVGSRLRLPARHVPARAKRSRASRSSCAICDSSRLDTATIVAIGRRYSSLLPLQPVLRARPDSRQAGKHHGGRAVVAKRGAGEKCRCGAIDRKCSHVQVIFSHQHRWKRL